MGEVSDWMIDQQIGRGCNLGSWDAKKSSVRGTYTPPHHFNPYLENKDYNSLVRFLTMSLSNEKRLNEVDAKRLILDRLVKKGKFPYPRVSKLNGNELASLINIIKKSGLELDGYDETELQRKVELEEEKERVNMNRGFSQDRPKSSTATIGFETLTPQAEVEQLFRVETIDSEEGEFSVVIERGMYREVVAVSYAYPHYRERKFYAGRKSNIFSKEADTDKMVIYMSGIFESMATLLNNLASADLLTEDVYNNAVDGFEPFIYEALDYSEIQSLIGKTSGLKDGKKKRIKARGTKGSALQNK